MKNGTTDKNKEAKLMTKYYLGVARYFLSTTVLTGFGYTFST